MISTFQRQSNYCKQCINTVVLRLMFFHFRSCLKSIVNCATRRHQYVYALAGTHVARVLPPTVGGSQHRTDRQTEQLIPCSRLGLTSSTLRASITLILALRVDILRPVARLHTFNCSVCLSVILARARNLDGSIHPMVHADWLWTPLQRLKTHVSVTRS